ncbi:MAG TPA: helix-turn-helix domain-containing protein [Yinghuangia sp.]|uniref:helix-turn-helix domain-containing protein n=1 Tax=Yinghuangia sp. YIM S10712 TaxID=3436930 RepID=UPI002B6196AD|nr:helix-turn-helix domain-containing protein [Yinghuangia sp.]
MPVNPSPAVQRAGQILWLMARRPSESYSVSELARAAGIPRATCDSILQALAEQGLVTRQELRYELGAFCVALGDAARAANSVLNAAAREGEELARRLNSYVMICACVGDEVRVVTVCDWGPPLGMRMRSGQSIPLVAPFGAVFVAWDDTAAEAWLTRADNAADAEQADRWRMALDATRRRGYSISVTADRAAELASGLDVLIDNPDSRDARRRRDELIDAVQHSEYLAVDIDDDAVARLSHVSAPVFDRSGTVAASLMLLGSQHGLTGRELHALGRQVAQAAARATKTIGGSGT